MMQYSREDIETYMDYSHLLYIEVVKRFMPKVNIEGTSEKDLRAYGEAMGNSLGIQSIILQVYANVLESFSAWMQHDCVLTGHKTPFTESMLERMSDPSRDICASTGLHCKNCGYEIMPIKSNGEVFLVHTGIEEHYILNRYCIMVHRNLEGLQVVGGMANQKVAELKDEDLELFGKLLAGSGQRDIPEEIKGRDEK